MSSIFFSSRSMQKLLKENVKIEYKINVNAVDKIMSSCSCFIPKKINIYFELLINLSNLLFLSNLDDYRMFFAWKALKNCNNFYWPCLEGVGKRWVMFVCWDRSFGIAPTISPRARKKNGDNFLHHHQRQPDLQLHKIQPITKL
jgi:hypothetical protein